MSQHIHPTAIIDEQAQLAEDVSIGPYTIIGPEVSLGASTQIGSHCVLEHVQMGVGNRLSPGVYLGQPPQHLAYEGQAQPLLIGDHNQFREGFTAHRGMEQPTRIGNHGFFMAQSHVAHDCIIGDNVIMANGAVIGGHTEIGTSAFLSGNTAVHQFCRLGQLSFLSGVSAVNMDIMPFCIAAGRPAKLTGLNLVGLKRSGISKETLRAIKHAYHTLFLSGLRLEEALVQLESSQPEAEVSLMIEFARKAQQRGLARPERK